MTKKTNSPKKENNADSWAEACAFPGCKTKVKRFGFCAEHYEQFKFGLIKKTGEPVPDYEKKFEHYQAYLKKLRNKNTQKSCTHHLLN